MAAGGHDPVTGQGSRAVEFVGTSVSSPGIDSGTRGAIAGALRSANPHFKYINLFRRGSLLVDVSPQRVQLVVGGRCRLGRASERRAAEKLADHLAAVRDDRLLPDCVNPTGLLQADMGREPS